MEKVSDRSNSPKNAHPKVMNDLHPVALTSVPMKCLESIIQNLDDCPFAYRPRRNTEDAILTLINGICEHLEKVGAIAKVLFVDICECL